MKIKAVSFDTPGSAEVLKIIEFNISDPKDNEVQIEHTAIEVNYIDINQRKGLSAISGSVKIPGMSAIGEIVKIGRDVKGYKVGDRVGYATAASGAYTSARNIDANLLFAIPPEITDQHAACIMVRGLTAHYLLFRTFCVHAGMQILIHSAGSGVGKLMTQWAKHLDAYVIGTVGSEERRQAALDAGCSKVINYKTEDLVAKVKQYTQNIGVNAVYDGIGKDTFDKSLDCLMPIGIMILYGTASGGVDNIDIAKIAAKSLYFTRPRLADYKRNRIELLLSANEVFTAYTQGIITVDDPKVYSLADAAKAHTALEDRTHKTSIILVP